MIKYLRNWKEPKDYTDARMIDRAIQWSIQNNIEVNSWQEFWRIKNYFEEHDTDSPGKQVWFDAEDIVEKIYKLRCPYCGNCAEYLNVTNHETLFCEPCGVHFEAMDRKNEHM